MSKISRLIAMGVLGGGAATTTPTLTITALSAVANVASMRITASEAVSGFAVGDITISAGGSLANFATADNITFTVDWTLAEGANTMDIAQGVCASAANGGANAAATQYGLTRLTIQPAGAAGKDTNPYSGATGYNHGTTPTLSIGSFSGSSSECRTLIQFDLSTIPAGSTILSAILSLYITTDASTNASTVRVYRLKRAWVEGTRNNANDSPATGATWIRYDTTNNWQTAGGFGSDDCEQTDIGSLSLTATETLNVFKNWTLTASKIQEMLTGGSFTNNGFLMKVDVNTVANAYSYASSDDSTAGNRPKLAVVYHP